MRVVLFALAITVAVVASAAGQGTQYPPHPTYPECDPDDPSLLLPDLVPDDPIDIRNVYLSGRRVINFTSATANVGDGPLLIEGRTVSTADGVKTLGYQIIFRRDNGPCARPGGTFQFHASHQHWHWDNFVTYELRADDPVNGPIVASGGKASFCLLDVKPVQGYKPDDYPMQLTNLCKTQDGVQGISVGWKDVYERRYPDQIINLDPDPDHQVPSGGYYLVNNIDPDHLIWEKSTANNLSYSGSGVTLPPPDISDLPQYLPTPKPRPPRIPLPRQRPTRAPRPPKATRPPRDGGNPTATPTYGPPTETPRRPPTARPTVAPPPVDNGRPTRVPKPTREERPTRTPRGSGEEPTSPTGPTPTPTRPSGGSVSCDNACTYGLGQLRMTWYAALGLDFSMVVSEGGCPPLPLDSGQPVEVIMTHWITDTKPVRDTGLFHGASLVLSGDGRTASDGTHSVSFSPQGSGTKFTYTASVLPIAKADDGYNFPVAFDMCVKVGNQAIKMRPVCQPKATGMLCHL